MRLIYILDFQVWVQHRMLLWHRLRCRELLLSEMQAKEPEIVGLCDYLTGCGADIKGAGGDTIAVRGVDNLNDTVYTIPADRMVMGTYIASVCATRGDIKLTGCNICDAGGFLDVYTGMGLEYKECEDGICIFQKERPKAVNYIKQVYIRDFLQICSL